MRLDPLNPVVRLCGAGMEAEAERRFEDAADLFRRAWEARVTDVDAAVAAHFLARHQPDLRQGLHWNELALRYALAAPAAEAAPLLPSLYLNLAFSCELLERDDEALRHLEAAEAHLPALVDSPYTHVVKDGLGRMRERLSATAAPPDDG